IYWMFSPPAKVVYASNSIVETLKREPQPMRVFAFPVRQRHGPDPLLTGDGLMALGVRNLLGYHGNQIGRFNELVGLNSDDNRLFSPNVLQLTNTRYLLTNIPELPFIGNTTRAGGPVVDVSGDSLYLFRVNAENPYAWVTPVAVKAPDDQVLATVLNPRFDVRRAALFDTSAHVASAENVQVLPAPLGVTTTVKRYGPGSVSIDLSSPAPAGASLLVSENFYPGWLATVDGKPANIGRADYSLIGVELPQGARSVELRFTSPAYERGKVITWLAIVIGLLMLGAGIWRDRRVVA
ncbi:MAG: YfhO family protein, partial [Gemmatimonadaceae bacterium]